MKYRWAHYIFTQRNSEKFKWLFFMGHSVDVIVANFTSLPFLSHAVRLIWETANERNICEALYIYIFIYLYSFIHGLHIWCVMCKGASWRTAEVRGDPEGREAAAGADGSSQSRLIFISSQFTVRKHPQGLLTWSHRHFHCSFQRKSCASWDISHWFVTCCLLYVTIYKLQWMRNLIVLIDVCTFVWLDLNV